MDLINQPGDRGQSPREGAEHSAVQLRLIQEVGRAARRRRAAARRAPSMTGEQAAFLERKAAVYEALGRVDLAREARAAARREEAGQ